MWYAAELDRSSSVVVSCVPGCGSWAAIGIVLGILAIIGIPLTAVAMVMYALVPALGFAITFLIYGLAIWLTFSTSFAYDAILLDGVGPIAALLASMAIIRRHFWGAVGFFLLQTFILLGLDFIWSQLDFHSTGSYHRSRNQRLRWCRYRRCTPGLLPRSCPAHGQRRPPA